MNAPARNLLWRRQLLGKRLVSLLLATAHFVEFDAKPTGAGLSSSQVLHRRRVASIHVQNLGLQLLDVGRHLGRAGLGALRIRTYPVLGRLVAVTS